MAGVAVNTGEKGALAEEYAARALAGAGYEIKARNFRSRYGEVDIIAQKGGVIAFVEVKARRAGGAVSGLEAVTLRKQSRIIATAIRYLKASGCDLQPRFDVFCAVLKDNCVISHDYLEGAFDGDAYEPRDH